jgi:hypothetical protein
MAAKTRRSARFAQTPSDDEQKILAMMDGNSNGVAEAQDVVELPASGEEENIFLFWPNIIGKISSRLLSL